MKEKGIEVLDHYDLNIIRTGKIRGAILLITEHGNMLLKECSRTPSRVAYEQGLHKLISENSTLKSDVIMLNLEGEYLTTDAMQTSYIVKKWYQGSECKPDDRQEVCNAMAVLGEIHNILNGYGNSTDTISGNMIGKYEKYNRELRRARNYVRGRRHKTDFELRLIDKFDEFYENCEMALERLKASSYERMYIDAVLHRQIVHGDYNYHNIINIGPEDNAVVNFEGACIDLNIMDVYHFLRKVMEKNNWNVELGQKMIESYNRVKNISDDELELLKIFLLYPEKFRKVVNYYYNGNKSWIPGKNVEKLDLVHKQMILRDKFVQFL